MVKIHHCPAAVSGNEIFIETTVLEKLGWEGGESRKIHKSENLTSGLKSFRGEGDWFRNFFITPSP